MTDAKNPQEEELDRLFKAAKKADPKAQLMVVLAYNGALRVSELIHVKVSDFNWMTGRMRMIPLKKAGKRNVKQSDVSIKVVDKPLPSALEYQLPSNVVLMVKDYVRKERLKDDSWLFPGNVRLNGCHIVKLECPGGHVSKRKVQMVWDSIAGDAGIKVPSRGIHSLKHGRLTEVAMKSKDPFFVKEVGRHSSVTMSDHYVKYALTKEKIDDIGGRT